MGHEINISNSFKQSIILSFETLFGSLIADDPFKLFKHLNILFAPENINCLTRFTNAF